jgi:hypothetical protein
MQAATLSSILLFSSSLASLTFVLVMEMTAVDAIPSELMRRHVVDMEFLSWER